MPRYRGTAIMKDRRHAKHVGAKDDASVAKRVREFERAMAREDLFAARDCSTCDGMCRCERLAHPACRAGARAAQKARMA